MTVGERVYYQYSMLYDVYLKGRGAVSSCRRRHKVSRNMCKVMIVSKEYRKSSN